ncbi:hypothetical protein POTOM_055994 [Populus tomentosa]|uniref:Uncharacterized protein n=1 Tax=Populus tomentosa TaxID=118781 RepID=A0A8X7XTY5_POPTO|nr:hypothetical protein POTOM_055994 [Populus tomentosa]
MSRKARYRTLQTILKSTAAEMFGISPSNDKRDGSHITFFRDKNFKINILSKEYQHICRSIGLMLWESAPDLVVANDGDKKALELLAQNVYSKLQPSLAKRIMKRLGWENREHIEAIKELHSGGFEVIIGTDVTYIPDAILLLFATAMELKSCDSNGGGDKEQALILCLIFRRVEENHPYFQLHLKLVLSWLINGQQEFHLIHLKAL